jgi:hypothetical protein
MNNSNFKSYFILIVIIVSNQIAAQFNRRIFYDSTSNSILNERYFYTDILSKTTENLNNIRMDSIITFSTQGSTSKHLFAYNKSGKMTELLSIGNNGTGWDKSLKYNFIYNDDENLIAEIVCGWNTDRWDSLDRITYSYDSLGNREQSMFQIFSENNWVNRSHTSYEYDTDGNIIELQIKDWKNDQWYNSNLASCFYTPFGEIDFILFQTWGGYDWQNYSKSIFYYNLSQSLDSLVLKIWERNGWANYFKRDIIYSSNSYAIQLDQKWNGINWENVLRRGLTYNDFNFIMDAFCEIWKGNDWETGEGDIVIEGPSGFTIGFITYSLSIYYSDINTSLTEKNKLQPTGYHLSQNYPNPFNPSTFIEFQIAEFSFVSLKIYDLLGREIATLVDEEKFPGNYKVEFNAGDLPSGTYYYQIKAGSFFSTKKLLLIK